MPVVTEGNLRYYLMINDVPEGGKERRTGMAMIGTRYCLKEE